MGWFGGSGGSPSKLSPVTEFKEEKQQKFLEDLPPKFEDQETADYEQQSAYKEAFNKFKITDLNPTTFAHMPCFREAMMTGFQAMAVLGGVTFLIHKNPNKSLNWGVCGFFLGNIIGWEQCRSLRKKSFQTMERARQANMDKNEKKWEENAHSDKDERLEKWKQVQEYYNNKK